MSTSGISRVAQEGTIKVQYTLIERTVRNVRLPHTPVLGLHCSAISEDKLIVVTLMLIIFYLTFAIYNRPMYHLYAYYNTSTYPLYNTKCSPNRVKFDGY